MHIAQYFDPHDVDHVKAYQHLQEDGSWPEGFIPEDVKAINGWRYLVDQKIIDAWIRDTEKLHAIRDTINMAADND
jgi:hypothetical protein